MLRNHAQGTGSRATEALARCPATEMDHFTHAALSRCNEQLGPRRDRLPRVYTPHAQTRPQQKSCDGCAGGNTHGSIHASQLHTLSSEHWRPSLEATLIEGLIQEVLVVRRVLDD